MPASVGNFGFCLYSLSVLAALCKMYPLVDKLYKKGFICSCSLSLASK